MEHIKAKQDEKYKTLIGIIIKIFGIFNIEKKDIEKCLNNDRRMEDVYQQIAENSRRMILILDDRNLSPENVNGYFKNILDCLENNIDYIVDSDLLFSLEDFNKCYKLLRELSLYVADSLSEDVRNQLIELGEDPRFNSKSI